MAQNYELKDNSMSLLKNGYKDDGDNRPDYTGDAKIGGVDMKATLWINKTYFITATIKHHFTILTILRCI